MKGSTIVEIISVLYMILFLYTGVSKLTDYNVFREQLIDSPVLSPVAKPVALLLPWTEFAVVLLLLYPPWRLTGLYASLLLMVVFTSYILVILSFSDHLPCSCGGIIQQLSWKQHLLFNSAFIVAAIWAILLQRKQIKDQRINQTPVTYS